MDLPCRTCGGVHVVPTSDYRGSVPCPGPACRRARHMDVIASGRGP